MRGTRTQVAGYYRPAYRGVVTAHGHHQRARFPYRGGGGGGGVGAFIFSGWYSVVSPPPSHNARLARVVSSAAVRRAACVSVPIFDRWIRPRQITGVRLSACPRGRLNYQRSVSMLIILYRTHNIIVIRMYLFIDEASRVGVGRSEY